MQLIGPTMHNLNFNMINNDQIKDERRIKDNVCSALMTCGDNNTKVFIKKLKIKYNHWGKSLKKS